MRSRTAHGAMLLITIAARKAAIQQCGSARNFVHNCYGKVGAEVAADRPMRDRETVGEPRERGSRLRCPDAAFIQKCASAPPGWLAAMNGLLLGTRDSSAGGPTSAKNLLARSRSGATPFLHGNGSLKVCKRCDDTRQKSERQGNCRNSRALAPLLAGRPVNLLSSENRFDRITQPT